MKELLKLMAYAFSYMCNYKLLNHVKRFKNIVYWYSLRRSFGAVGAGSFIEMPSMILHPKNVFIGKDFYALTYFRLETVEEYEGQKFTPKIIIGDNVSFNNDCHIGCINRIEIGNNVLGASRIYITDHYHGDISSSDLETVPSKRKLTSKGSVKIKDNVWIGECVSILPGVTIGENAIIGANSVVNKDVPPNSVVAGVPAKIIKYLR